MSKERNDFKKSTDSISFSILDIHDLHQHLLKWKKKGKIRKITMNTMSLYTTVEIYMDKLYMKNSIILFSLGDTFKGQHFSS